MHVRFQSGKHNFRLSPQLPIINQFRWIGLLKNQYLEIKILQRTLEGPEPYRNLLL